MIVGRADPPLISDPVKSKIQTVKRKKNPLGHVTRLRGVVHCMDCQKPRCIYSSQAIAQLKPPNNDHTREEEI
jgi:hypothetical protein